MQKNRESDFPTITVIGSDTLGDGLCNVPMVGGHLKKSGK
jgi:hypothetical protein